MGTKYFPDRIVELTTTTGLGDITLNGTSPTGYDGFAKWFMVGDKFDYLILAVDGDGAPTGQWEVGEGTITDDDPNYVFSRDVWDSSENFDPVDFGAGTKRVACVAMGGTIDTLSVGLAGGGSSSATAALSNDEYESFYTMTFEGAKTLELPSYEVVDFSYGFWTVVYNRAAAGNITLDTLDPPVGAPTVLYGATTIAPGAGALLWHVAGQWYAVPMGGGGGGGSAATTTFTPAGGLAATNVQAALEELDTEKMGKAGGTFTGDIVVPDEAYDATAWDGSLEAPTKNAIRDKIEAIVPASIHRNDGANVAIYTRAAAGAANVTGNAEYYTVPYDTNIQARSFATLNTSTGVVTINEAGTYIVEGSVRLEGGASQDWAEGCLLRNGSTRVYGVRGLEYTDEGVVVPHVVTVFDFQPGNTIAFQARVGGSTTIVDVNIGTEECYLKVAKLSIGGGGGAAFRGALVKKAADLTAQNVTAGAVITFDTETYDIGGWHDNVTNNARLTVPAGVTKVRVSAQVRTEAGTAADWRQIFISKNGTAAYAGVPIQFFEPGSAQLMTGIQSGVLEVVPGDYFQLHVQTESDTSVDIDEAQTWFAIEAVEVVNSAIGRGALVKKAADQNAANYTTLAAIAWDGEEYDDLAIHDNVTNNSRLTVPAGVSRVRLWASVTLANVATGSDTSLQIRKNGAAFIGRGATTQEITGTGAAMTTETCIVAVTPGDYFEAWLSVAVDTSVDVVAAGSGFAMEVVA